MTRILVVDDSPDMRSLLQAELQHAGYTVQAAENSGSAVTMQQLFRADMVITDLFMPGGDGFELIAVIREKFPAAKIIAISGAKPGMDTDCLGLAKKAGADATLQKPFRPDVLLKLVRSLVA